MAKNYECKLSIDWLEIAVNSDYETKDFFRSIRFGKTVYFGENEEISISRVQSLDFKCMFEIKCLDADNGLESAKFNLYSDKETHDRVKENFFNRTKDIYKRDENEHEVPKNDLKYHRVGYLMFDAYKPMLDGTFIRFDNRVYYSWAIHALTDVVTALGLEFSYVRKLDICVDFNFDMLRYLKKAYCDLDYSVIVNRRVADNKAVHGVWFDAWNTSRVRPYAKWNIHVRGNGFGSSSDINNTQGKGNKDKGSPLSFKAYNKEEEIAQSKKHYIIEDIGFIPKIRLEVSCRNHKSLKKTLDPLKITDETLFYNLTNESFLMDIFNHLLFRLIHFKHTKKRKLCSWLELALMKMESKS